MEKLKNIVFLVLLIAYLAVVSGFIGNREETGRISALQVHVKDSTTYQFIGANEVLNMLRDQSIQPVGKTVDEIILGDIENHLMNSQIIRKADVYITEPGILHLDVLQKDPFLRIINQAGQGYYLDRTGNVIPLSANFSPFVLVATGNIHEPFSIAGTVNILEYENDMLSKGEQVIYELFELASFIEADAFWKAQIEQIFVDKNYDFELVPRVGPHIIEFGTAENMEEKFSKLRLLYTEGLNYLGWNQYIRINVKYKNQIVCTKI